MSSSDFEIFSTAGQGSTMDVLHHFEEVRSFFAKFAGGSNSVQPSEPVRIIVFGSEKEYMPYRPSEAAAAFYTQVAGRDYIVLSGVSENVFPVAVHEYVHLVAQHHRMNLPPWMNEGIADTYSTLKPTAGKILIGSVPPGRITELLRTSWIPLATILAVDMSSPWYNEKKKAGAFYAESWAFVHMLLLSPEYSARFSKLVDALGEGTRSQEVVEKLYGKPLSAFDKEVQGYIRGSRLSGAIVNVQLDGSADAHTEPAEAFDVKLALLDLLNRPEKKEERRKGLSELAAQYPQRPEPHSALGYLDMRGSETAEGMKEFKAAVDLGGRNPQMLWDYGRMAAGRDSAEALRVLKILLAQDTDRVDVRLLIAQLQFQAKQSQEALVTLAPIKKVTPKDAPTLFRTAAYAQLNLGDFENAKKSGQRWVDTAREPTDQENAKRFMSYLEASRAAKNPPAEAILTTPDSAPPVLRRNENTNGTSTAAATAPRLATRSYPSVTGTFVEFDCTKKQPRFVLSTPQGKVAFLMEDPQKVFIRGRDTDTIDLYCGAQKESAVVWIEYDPPPSSETDVRGIARFVHFEAPGAAK
ncbi:MAG TPA: tetratricopeptide repeat protein [Bryobacteraceae bacterium]|nr:tetratricopeptide repeat protein [Bryobacteraceae bacterium]